MSEMTEQQLKNIVEAALLAAGEPLSVDRLYSLFEEEQPEKKAIKAAIEALQADCEGRGVELRELASGYRYQAKSDVSRWVSRLWEERAPRYSRALLETLALVAYRQPITRAEIEDIRGVAVSSSIMKTLMERGWVRIIGHRDVPGRPALYASTKEFLDYFNLKSLDDLPTLNELKDIDKINAELDLRLPGEGADVEGGEGEAITLSIGADFEPVAYD
jgi:segregation and condensation protein B